MCLKLARALLISGTLMLLALVSATGISRGDDSSVVIATIEGPVRGIRRDGVREFLGIPYAAPPVGHLRWRSPEPHPHWKTVFGATHMGPSCPQFLPGAETSATSEDCLVLNIYAPDPPRTGLPVMVWIHGGAFILGSGAMFDGSALARKYKLVMVVVNYRLGALGFLTLPGLEAESPTHISGNYGLLDQQAALKWVRRNIGAFGGASSKVTIAGESAGGISVCAQLVSPGASGLFRGAIIESGPCLRQATRADGEETGRELVTRLGCDKAGSEVACLRSKSAEQVRSAMPGSLQGPLLWAPVVDGHVLPRQPIEAFRSGSFNKVPVINGSNRDEGTLFIGFGKPLSPENYAAAVGFFARPRPLAPSASSHEDEAPKVLAEYPLSRYQSASQGLAAVLGDAIFSCPIETTDHLLSAFVPTYEYEFNDRQAPSTLIPHPPFPLGAYHASEIQYVFQTYFPAGRRSGSPDFSPAQRELSDQIAAYWSAFIAHRHPDNASPSWLAEKPGEMKILSLAPHGIAYESDFADEHHCAFWNSLAYGHKP
jgi:para-nitrobenzyl esterase